MCTGNSCRSQMAEHLARTLWRGICAKSAGTHPQDVHPLAAYVMEEIGVDMSSAGAKALDPRDLADVDLVITLCGDARDSCPVMPPGVECRHWPLDDPARAVGTRRERLRVFRRVRDEISERVKALMQEMDGPPGRSGGEDDRCPPLAGPKWP